eukprot:TRINITY_DN4617_c0_g1_i19.p1 TRINITY_DN4617_c0_g1~~TRINITY_DN4617_c0_g1_i19.p1  ORF type:complete len:165 (+),score=1.22 TRINITY_DN4617_c0_g1_i19:1111-1605(+)
MKEARVAGLIDKCHDVISIIKASPKLMEQLSEFKRKLSITAPKLKLDVKTRWNSVYDMINSLLRKKSAVMNLYFKGSKKLTSKTISEEEWQSLAAIKGVVYPFYKITKNFSSNVATVSGIMPILHNVFESILLSKESDQEVATVLKGTIKKRVSQKAKKVPQSE